MAELPEELESSARTASAAEELRSAVWRADARKDLKSSASHAVVDCARRARCVALQLRAHRRAAACALVVALALGIAIAQLFAAERVRRGVFVDSVALSGLNRAEAERALRPLAEHLSHAPAFARVGERVLGIAPHELGFMVEVPATVTRALRAGKEGIFGQFDWWFARWFSPERIEPVVSLDEAALDRVLRRWENEALAGAPFDGALEVQDGVVIARLPRRGRAIDRAEARRLLGAALARGERSAVTLPTRESGPRTRAEDVERAAVRARQLLRGPVELIDEIEGHSARFEPGELGRALRMTAVAERSQTELVVSFDAQALLDSLGERKKTLEHAPRDARFIIDLHEHVAVEPSRVGIRLDRALLAEAVLQAAAAPARVGPLPLVRSEVPRLTTEDALALGIKQLVSRFSTHHACCQPRVHNIHRIADIMNDVLVRPGETFSVNQVVGVRTTANGFVLAPSIEDGEMVDTVGGGISQFATTLFNAVFYGGYEIVERTPHTYWFSRYPMGHEATLSWPKPDLVFRNDSDAGLLIRTEYTDTRITVKLYGDSGGRRVRAEVSGMYDIVEPPVVYTANPTLSPDVAKVLDRGMIGWSVTATRIVGLSDGNEQRQSRKVTYKPRERRVEVHPCKIPKDQPGHSDQPCPEPKGEDGGLSEDNHENQDQADRRR